MMLSSGERAIFAAAFAPALYAGRYPLEAATQAATAVLAARHAARGEIPPTPLLVEANDAFVQECLASMLQD